MVRPRFVRAGPAAIALEAALAPVIVLAAATAPVAGVPAIVLAAAVAVKKLQLVRLAAASPVQARVPRGGGGHNAFAGSGGGGRAAAASASRGHTSMSARGGGGGGGARAGGGGGGRGGGGGGGRGGGGGGGGRRSDIALKHDISLLGHLDNGLGFYRFSYNGSDKAYVGVMAQEVQEVAPDAVMRGRDGYLRVFYDKLGLQFQTYDQWLATGARIPSAAPQPH